MSSDQGFYDRVISFLSLIPYILSRTGFHEYGHPEVWIFYTNSQFVLRTENLQLDQLTVGHHHNKHLIIDRDRWCVGVTSVLTFVISDPCGMCTSVWPATLFNNVGQDCCAEGTPRGDTWPRRRWQGAHHLCSIGGGKRTVMERAGKRRSLSIARGGHGIKVKFTDDINGQALSKSS